MNVQTSPKRGKRVRARRHTDDEKGTVEMLAFVRGQADFDRGPAYRCPFVAPDMIAAWERGRTFADNAARGLRPIDAVRRKP